MQLNQFDIDCAIAAKAIIDKDIRRNYSAVQLADQLGIREVRLTEAFKAMVRKSIYDYQRQQRMVIARSMFEEGMSVKKVSLTVGYKSTASFIRAFKMRYNISPGKLAKANVFHPGNIKNTAPLAEALTFLHQLHPLTHDLKAYLLAVLKTQEYPAGSFLIKAGQVCTRAFYLNSGVVRWFNRLQEQENTIWFMTRGHPILMAQSLYEQTPSSDSLQALTPCKTVYIEHHDLMKVYDLFPEAQTMGRKISDQYNEQMKLYAAVLRMPHAEDRYHYLQQQFPALIWKVEAAYLASFINVDESTFYKMRKRYEREDQETLLTGLPR